MIYNPKDNIWYCTNAERLAAIATNFADTSKFYEVDTKLAYVLYKGTFYPA